METMRSDTAWSSNAPAFWFVIQHAAGPMQFYVGQTFGVEAAINSMRKNFTVHENFEGFLLLVDASNF